MPPESEEKEVKTDRKSRGRGGDHHREPLEGLRASHHLSVSLETLRDRQPDVT